MNNVRESLANSGFTLIEVLITVVILAIGLLGLASLQMSSLNNQLESYQRAQAMMLLEDMSNRIRVNAAQAKIPGVYPQGVAYGLVPEWDCADIALTVAERDQCEWNTALAGSAVTLESQDVGSIAGARGCLENIPGSVDGETIIRLTIAWQGMSKTRKPSSTCGEDQYGSGEDDAYRRTVSLDTVLADLTL